MNFKQERRTDFYRWTASKFNGIDSIRSTIWSWLFWASFASANASKWYLNSIEKLQQIPRKWIFDLLDRIFFGNFIDTFEYFNNYALIRFRMHEYFLIIRNKSNRTKYDTQKHSSSHLRTICWIHLASIAPAGRKAWIAPPNNGCLLRVMSDFYI